MYRDDIKELDNHLQNTVNSGYSVKDIQHLGGAAALKKELEEKCMGDACKFKNDLAGVIAMVHPGMTKLQKEMVEDRLHAFEQKIELIGDAGQKAEAQKWYDKVQKEINNIEEAKKDAKTDKEDERTMIDHNAKLV